MISCRLGGPHFQGCMHTTPYIGQIALHYLLQAANWNVDRQLSSVGLLHETLKSLSTFHILLQLLQYVHKRQSLMPVNINQTTPFYGEFKGDPVGTRQSCGGA